MILPRRRWKRSACCLATCAVLTLAINICLFLLRKDNSTRKPIRAISKSNGIAPVVSVTSISFHQFDAQGLQQDLLCDSDSQVPWSIARTWLGHRQIYPARSPYLGCLLRQMATAKITHATTGKGGTQMKLLLTLEGGQKVIFKPKRYPRDYIVQGTPYAGFDRHNGEIAAFHLNRLLDLRRGPIIAGRKISLTKEIIPVAEKKLLSTFLTKDGQLCFYGVCYYCVAEDAACAENDTMEGAIILWFPHKVKLTKPIRHPWSRTYKAGVRAQWEVASDYCEMVKNFPRYRSGLLLLDIMDTSIVDFLIGNADRHNYQIFEELPVSMLVLLDNGKSFGDPFHDEDSILTPLEQCCLLRQSTWETLLLFANRTLGSSLQRMLAYDRLTPILTDDHYRALDRRLEKVLEAIQNCFTHKGKLSVLVHEHK